MNVLREPMQRTLQRLVMENRTDTKQELPALARIWMECGFRDGEAKGEVKGKIDAVREIIFRGAQRRGLVLSDEQQARIHACNDLVTLDRWFDNVFDAKTADELFR
jgi:hypothetical protein